MEDMQELAGRRPLKSRASAWAGGLSRVLAGSGVSANMISVFSVVFDTLESGRSIIIFPEGTRSPDGSLNIFKPGIFHLREKFPECAMIPVSLQNLNRILPKGQAVPLPLIGRITVHPPLADVADESRADFLARARAAVAAGLQRNPCDEQ